NIFAPEGEIKLGNNPSLPNLRAQRFWQFVDIVSLARGRHQLKFGGDLIYLHAPRGPDNIIEQIQQGSVVFFDLDFAALAGIPGLPRLNGLAALVPALRTPKQRAFLAALAALLPLKYPVFPRGVPLADLPLPAFYLQGFGDGGLDVTTREWSGFA